jgi:hypothetical protein
VWSKVVELFNENLLMWDDGRRYQTIADSRWS